MLESVQKELEFLAYRFGLRLIGFILFLLCEYGYSVIALSLLLLIIITRKCLLQRALSGELGS